MMFLGKVFAAISAESPRLAVRVTSARLPAETSSVSNFRGPAPPIVSTRNPMNEIPLGSVAWTVMLSFSSTRTPIVCVTDGGVVSFAAESTETVTTPLVPRRPPESSAKPTMLKVPVAASTVSVSVYNTESAYGIAKLMESLGGPWIVRPHHLMELLGSPWIVRPHHLMESLGSP